MWKSVSALLVWGVSTAALSQALVLETWRVDDEALWKAQFLPRFQALHPEITLKLQPQRSADYDQGLAERLAAGKAGDLITCRPYDQSLRLFQQGYLLDLTELPGMENFPSFAKAAWQTDSGAQTFCLPIASVIQGFYFNIDIFNSLGLTPPRTRADFFAVLEKVKQDGRYLPLALAAHDSWVVSELGYQNIGPNYWRGEDGRLALINGQARVTDAPYVAAFRELASWRPYLGEHPADTTEAQAVDAFAAGKAAMIVAGSWSLAQFTGKVNFGAFPPPVAREGDTCYFTDHTDMGIGINAASPNKEAALKLVEWMASADFAERFSNSVPGFFSLSNHFFELKDPVASTMMGWRDTCDSTLRLGAQFLTRGEPSLTTELADVSQSVVLGTLTPEAAAARIQQGLASWYPPQKAATKRARLCEADAPLSTQATSAGIGTESPFATP